MQSTSVPHIKDIIARLDSQLLTCDDPLLSKKQIVSEAQDITYERYLFVRKGVFGFAIPMASVIELSPLGSVTSLPNLPVWINGVTSLRGDVVSAIDLPAYFQWTARVGTVGEHIVTVQHGDVRVGICVEKIVGSNSIDPETEITHQVGAGEQTDVVFAKGHSLHGQMFCILDIEELLTQDKMVQW